MDTDLLQLSGATTAVRAAFRYDRRGYEAFDVLRKPCRNRHGSEQDAMVIQATFLVQAGDSEPARVFNEVRGSVLAEQKRKKLREARARLQEALAGVEAAQSELDQLAGAEVDD